MVSFPEERLRLSSYKCHENRGFLDNLKEFADLLYGLPSHSFNLIYTLKHKWQEALFVTYKLCHWKNQETRHHLLYICDRAQAAQPWWEPLCDNRNGCTSILRSHVTVYAQLAAPAHCQAACRLNNLKCSLNTSCKSEKFKGKHHVCPVPAWHLALKAQAV